MLRFAEYNISNELFSIWVLLTVNDTILDGRPSDLDDLFDTVASDIAGEDGFDLSCCENLLHEYDNFAGKSQNFSKSVFDATVLPSLKGCYPALKHADVISIETVSDYDESEDDFDMFGFCWDRGEMIDSPPNKIDLFKRSAIGSERDL